MAFRVKIVQTEKRREGRDGEEILLSDVAWPRSARPKKSFKKAFEPSARGDESLSHGSLCFQAITRGRDSVPAHLQSISISKMCSRPLSRFRLGKI